MIRSFRHKGLKRLYEEDDRRKLPAEDVASSPEDMNVPGYRLHPLKGDLKGFWAVTVRANWRVIFRFDGGEAIEVDFVDYH